MTIYIVCLFFFPFSFHLLISSQESSKSLFEITDFFEISSEMYFWPTQVEKILRL